LVYNKSMSKGHFYEKVIETSKISLELGDMNLSSEERRELTILVSKNIHAVVLDTVLSELSDEDKKTFLKNLSENNHEKIWQHLKVKVNKIEEKIKQSIEETKNDLLEDIRQAKKLSR
jgi:actin-like ATPase involved in cell morphogenesis